MNLFSLASLSLSVACLMLAFLIFYFSRQKLHIYWALFNVSVGIYGLGMYLAGSAKIYEQAFFYWKIALFGVANISLFFYLVVHEFCKLKNRKILFFSICHSFLFSTLSLATGWIVNSLKFRFNQFYFTVAGIGWNIFFAIWMGVTITAFTLLYKYIKTCNPMQASKGKYLFYGMLLGFSSGATASLPSWGIEMYPVWHFFICVYAGICTYAIFRHQLLDIEVIVRRTVVFAGLFAVVFGVIAAFTYLGNEFFKNVLGWNQWLAVVPSVFLIVAIYRPLETWLVNLTEKFLFQKKYEYKYIIRQYIDEVVTEYDLDKIIRGTTYILDNTIHPEHFSIYLLDKDKNIYVSKSRAADSFDVNSGLVSYFNASRTFVSIEKESVASGLSTELRPRKVVLALPMFLQSELLGFFLMGPKKSGENYSPEDLQTLTDLAQVEAIVIHTAQYIHELQLMHAQMLRDNQARNIAEMSDGISHQFHNRFFAISNRVAALRQLITHHKKRFDALDEDLKKAVDTLYEGLNKAYSSALMGVEVARGILKYSRPEKAGAGKQDLQKVIESSIEMEELKNDDFLQIDVTIHKNPDVPETYGVFSYLQDIFNIMLHNSYDAIKERKDHEPGHQGKIHVEITYLKDTHEIQTRIYDNGFGMEPEILQKVRKAIPYVTTKASSEEKSGYGSGMQVLARLVKLHDGRFDYESKRGEGTCAIIIIPVKDAPHEQ